MSSFLTIKRSSENVKLERARVTLKPGNSILLTALNTLQRKLAAHSAQNAQFPLLKGSLFDEKSGIVNIKKRLRMKKSIDVFFHAEHLF